jgi:hypothetical protein
MNSTLADLVHVIESAACGKNYIRNCMQRAETIVMKSCTATLAGHTCPPHNYDNSTDSCCQLPVYVFMINQKKVLSAG